MRPHEQLEDRRLLAGDVTVSWVTAGSYAQLNVVGDGASNQVEVSTTAGGDVVVTAVGDTTVNGGASVTYSNASGLRWIYADLGGGNDSLRAVSWQSATVGAGLVSVSATAGDGNDTFEFRNAPLTAAASFYLYGGAGNDAFQISGLSAHEVNIDLGTDANNVVLSGLTLDAVNINASAAISGTSQKDHVELLGLSFRGFQGNHSSISLGFGDDELLVRGGTINDGTNGLYVDMGEGNDWMIFDGGSRWAGLVEYTGGAGNDDFSAANATIGRFDSDDGFGHDRWYFSNSRLGRVDISDDALRPSPGREVFWMVGCDINGTADAGVFVSLGDGNDTVYVASTRCTVDQDSSIVVTGGDGNDQIGFNGVTGARLDIFTVGGDGDDQVSFEGGLIRNVFSEDHGGANSFSMYQTQITDRLAYDTIYPDGTEPAKTTTDTVWIHSSGVWGNYDNSSRIVLGASQTSTPSSLRIFNSVFRCDTLISSGAGIDTVTAENTFFQGRTLNVDLGGGDDQLRLVNNVYTVTESFVVDGGAGFDTLTPRGTTVRPTGLAFAPINFEAMN